MSQKPASRKAKTAPTPPARRATPSPEASLIPDFVIDSLPGLFTLLDAEGKRIRWNRNLETVTGYSSEEVAGLRRQGIFIESDRERVAAAVKKAFVEGSAVMEAHLLCKNGTTTPYRFTGTRVLLEGKPYLVAVGLDVSECKRKEAALERSETLFRLLNEHIADGMAYQVDCGPDGRQRTLTYLSPAVERLHGLTLGNALRDSSCIYDQVIEEDRAFIAEAEARAIATQTAFDVDVRVRLPSGEIRWRHFRSAPHKLPDGRIVWDGIEFDITDRKQTEEAQEQNDKLLRFISENLADGMVYQIDCGPDGRQRAFSYLSPAIERMHGLKVDDVRRDPRLLYNQLIERDRTVLVEREAHAFAAQTPLDVDVQVRLPSGEIRWRHFRSAPRTLPNGHIVWDGIELDITERKQAEEALRQRAEQYRATLDSMTDLLFVLDREGRFVNYHALADHRLYSPPEEFIGRLFGETLPPNVTERLQKAIDIIRNRGPVQRVDYELELDGQHTSWSSNVSPRWDAAGQYDGATIVARDMTEQRLLEERLRQSEKLTAIGQLAGGIAHDFNNQLAGIMGFAELMADDLKEGPIFEYAEGILLGAQRAADLTQKLLAFSRKGKYLAKPVAVQPLLDEVATILARSIDKRILISQIPPTSDPAVFGDPSQIQNAFLNVALNARDAMPQGGQLVFATVVVTLDADDCRRDPCEIKPGPYVRVSISDTGTGMTAEQKRHLFEPFFTTKAPGKGTGMGLASVYGTVRNHHGSVHIYSEEGRGTTVHIFLPLVAAAPQPSARKPEPALPGGTARILLVDDEEIVRTMATAILRNLGYHVTTCADGREAVAYYEANWQHVDLVILDMVMPEVTGRDAFIAMRRINPRIRALLSSGYALNSEAQGILDEGVMAFIGKPYRQSELADAVTEALARD